MGHKGLRWVIALACAVAMSTALAGAWDAAGQLGPAAKDKGDVPHTLTWWCVDLNDVWNVNVPVILQRVYLQPPSPQIHDTCTSAFPVTVPAGSGFAPGFNLWFTNKTYPPATRAALQELGYRFHSQSPAEDFMSKFENIRVEVRTYPGNKVVGEYNYDPRRSFRLVRLRDFFGAMTGSTTEGTGFSVEEAGRLPLFGFPVTIPAPIESGDYWIWVYWTMSETHYDGVCLDESCMLPAGEFLYLRARFTVVP
jgi:hypothetical protein